MAPRTTIANVTWVRASLTGQVYAGTHRQLRGLTHWEEDPGWRQSENLRTREPEVLPWPQRPL